MNQLTKAERKNDYLTGREIIRNQTKFQLKGLKTFMGMECPGVNVNLYLDGKKIGDAVDGGDGGCLWINYYGPQNLSQQDRDSWNDNVKKAIDTFLNSLSTYTNKEMGWDFKEDEVNKWGEEQFWNELIAMATAKRDYKKDMKKVQVIDEDNKLCHYKFGPRDLEKPYKNKNGKIVPLHKLLIEDHKCKTILNMLPESESFDIWFQTVYSKHA